MTIFKTVALGIGLTLGATAAYAEYPEKDIRIIVPWGAGGGTDGIVRKLATIAEQEIGASMYVENIEGGISATGVSQLMGAEPDGYTIGVLTYDSVVTVPWQNLVPDYSLDRLNLIARVTSEPDALIVSTDSDYKTIEDVLADAKERPGKVIIGIQNIGSRLHLAALQLQEETGTEFKLIAYPGGAAAQKEAMLNGEVQIVSTSLGDFSSLLDDDKAMGVVEFTDAQNLTYTSVPTAAAKGLDLRMGSFIVVAAPAGVPEDVAQKVEGAFQTALESDEFQSWVSKIGVTPNWLGTAEVTDWTNATAEAIYRDLDKLVEDGVISK
ncbi:Bug family tripartite tricarboxylate transporter substrate binding protein [Actibacterium lipolyticum]|uniref:Tripartite tricarboxylate transporter family receptor n=1 Tax=Actibacterium lipolyticum TaxID=1524263 RepID=A0A238JKB3_9RHOB|nr:tripartite tricarboxylate transporter substrate binding protein [Actibacterium lipolyticum]SMX31090.1 Tripartite tricarboxylate transporter family receptor [Actibacterium lipolyticum]